jgi:Family of unknown function (DUF5994)
MNRADPLPGGVVSQRDSPSDVVNGAARRRKGTTTLAGEAAARPTGPRRLADQVRLTLASRLGGMIDGAWWPRTGQISYELPELVSVLDVRLGGVVDINVNWSSLQRQPDLNWEWWRGIRPHIITVAGRDARAKLLIVPHRTGTALAVMVLRRAAGLPIHAAHRESRVYETAECIVRVARGETMFEERRPRSATLGQCQPPED